MSAESTLTKPPPEPVQLKDSTRRLRMLVAILLPVAGLLTVSSYQHDDAYITFRYVERIVSGLGITWSGTEPVEGYTHPLWLAILVVGRSLGVAPHILARALGALSVITIVLIMPKRSGKGIVSLAALSLPTLCWAVSGLETVAFAAASLGACVMLAYRAGRLAGILAAAVSLLRPEGIVVIIALALATLLGRRIKWRGLDQSAKDTSLLWLVLPTLVAQGGLLAMRLSVFGEWLPNTAIAKLGVRSVPEKLLSGLRYVVDSLPTLFPLILCLGFVGVVYLYKRKEGPPPAPDGAAVHGAIAALLLGGAYVAGCIWVGGDHMVPKGRMLVPAVLVLAGALQLVAGPLVESLRMTTYIVPLFGVLLVFQVSAAHQAGYGADVAFIAGRWAGRTLAQRLPPGTLVAVATAGTTPYYALELEFIDTLGLNDKVIARTPLRERQTHWEAVPGHERGNGPYVLSRKPDVVVLGPAPGFLGNVVNMWFRTDHELITNPEFDRLYSPWAIPVDAPFNEHAGHRAEVPTWTFHSNMPGDWIPTSLVPYYTANTAPLVVFLRDDSEKVKDLKLIAIPLEASQIPPEKRLFLPLDEMVPI